MVLIPKIIGITGSSGMLGQCVVKAIKKCEFFRLIEVGRNSFDEPSNVWDLAEWKNIDELDTIFSNVSAVVHLGAFIPETFVDNVNLQMFNVNIGSTICLAQWARIRGIPLVYVSGAIVYKNPYDLDISESSPKGFNGIGGSYGRSKLFADDILERERGGGLSLALLRPSSIYSSRLNGKKLISRFMKSALNGDSIVISEPINDSFNLIHGEDVASAIIKVLINKSWGTYNLGGEDYSLIDIANTCIQVAGYGKLEVKKSINKELNSSSLFSLNSNKALKEIGWTPEINLMEGLKRIKYNQLSEIDKTK